jgi:hypothetical protein
VTAVLTAQPCSYLEANVVVAVAAISSPGNHGPWVHDKFMKDLQIYSTEKIKEQGVLWILLGRSIRFATYEHYIRRSRCPIKQRKYGMEIAREIDRFVRNKGVSLRWFFFSVVSVPLVNIFNCYTALLKFSQRMLLLFDSGWSHCSYVPPTHVDTLML